MEKFDDTGLFPDKFKGWMETYGGRKANPLNITADQVNIHAIAHALSLICRYGGHCKVFYSVADHSVRVSNIVPSPFKLAALLHDAGEAYFGDIIRPIKYSHQSLIELEDKALQVIMDKYHVQWNDEVKLAVKEADNIIGATEGRDLMYYVEEWGKLPDPLPDIIIPLPPILAELAYLRHFELYGGKE